MHKLLSIFTFVMLTVGFTQPFNIADEVNLELANMPFTGGIVLTQESSQSSKPVGSWHIDLATAQGKRLTLGENGWQHSEGALVYRQTCGREANRYFVRPMHEKTEGKAKGKARAMTPCSNTLELADSQFDFAKLSPDQSKLAVERFIYDEENGYMYDVLVFDTQQQLLATFENHTSPAWLPDGRLIVGGAGIYISDNALQELEPITLFNEEGDVFAGANNLALNPSGTRLVFEHAGQIWHIDVEGHQFYELVTAEDYDMMLRFPAWSPDGRLITYLARSYDNDAYFGALFFTDVTSGESYAVDILELSEALIRGPLSWRASK